jgi:hypothetical protein
MRGALSDERAGLIFDRVTVSSNMAVISMYMILTVCMLLLGITGYIYIYIYIYIQYIHSLY